jgi:hypothetical protein
MEPIPRVTILDRPRVFKSSSQRSPEAVANYKIFHDESVRLGWVWGESPEINWCVRHHQETYLEAGKAHCGECGKEAVSFMLSLKRMKLPAFGRPIPQETPYRRRGNVTGRIAGKPPRTNAFNAPACTPSRGDNLYIERRY